VKIQLDSETRTLTIDGVAISFEVLIALAHPDSSRFYRFVRSAHGTTIVYSFATEEEARGAAV
jgi:hypothetical protein